MHQQRNQDVAQIPAQPRHRLTGTAAEHKAFEQQALDMLLRKRRRGVGHDGHIPGQGHRAGHLGAASRGCMALGMTQQGSRLGSIPAAPESNLLCYRGRAAEGVDGSRGVALMQPVADFADQAYQPIDALLLAGVPPEPRGVIAVPDSAVEQRVGKRVQ